MMRTSLCPRHSFCVIIWDGPARLPIIANNPKLSLGTLGNPAIRIDTTTLAVDICTADCHRHQTEAGKMPRSQLSILG
jgi:hypothetical protein